MLFFGFFFVHRPKEVMVVVGPRSIPAKLEFSELLCRKGNPLQAVAGITPSLRWRKETERLRLGPKVSSQARPRQLTHVAPTLINSLFLHRKVRGILAQENQENDGAARGGAAPSCLLRDSRVPQSWFCLFGNVTKMQLQCF